jgi:phosphate transport system substrate-binding protein
MLLITPCIAQNLIVIDGSSTVFPITNAIAQEYELEEKGQTKVLVGISGSGGGFKKFCRGELDISNASRPINMQEKRLCASNNIKFIELPVALDAITVVVNKNNHWVQSMTVEELKTTWQKESENKVNTWDQINPVFPKLPLTLYGPGDDSGTYDYFIEAVIGDESRQDYHANEDDNVIAQGVANDINALAFFGFAYYEENKDKLKAISISWHGGEPVEPSPETTKLGTYQPLSRPVFIYVNKQSAVEFDFVQRFIELYMNAPRIIKQVKKAGYVPLATDAYHQLLATFNNRTTGSRFNGPEVEISIKELLERQPK